MVSGFSALGVKIINLNSVFKNVDDLVIDDIDRYCLVGKSKFIKCFAVLRLSSVVIDIIKKNKSGKILFFINKKNNLVALSEYYNFLNSLFLKLANILSLNFLIDSFDIDELQNFLHSETGEGKEVKARIKYIINTEKRNPNIEKLNKLFERYKISSTEQLYSDLNTKLSLFLT